MRFIYIFLLLPIFHINNLYANEMKIEGWYQGENIYVLNPIVNVETDEFCVEKVFVNDIEAKVELLSSAFEIDLQEFGFKIGDAIKIRLQHKNNCNPKIINPEVLLPRSTFTSGPLKVTRDGLLKWYTTNETSKMPFFVEQYKWNKWIKVAEVMGNGRGGRNEYSVKVLLNSGENIFRISQIDYTEIPRYSRVKKYRSQQAEIEYKTDKKTYINFSDETMYEIYTADGEELLFGQGTSVDISSLQKGDYYINFDNSTESLKLK